MTSTQIIPKSVLKLRNLELIQNIFALQLRIRTSRSKRDVNTLQLPQPVSSAKIFLTSCTSQLNEEEKYEVLLNDLGTFIITTIILSHWSKVRKLHSTIGSGTNVCNTQLQ